MKLDTWYAKIIINHFIFFAAMIVSIFLLAGRIRYWQGWVYSTVSLVTYAATFWLFSGKKNLIKERLNPGPGRKWWDKFFYFFYIPAFIAIILIGPLDTGRFGWTPELPVFVYIIAYAAYFTGCGLAYWAMWVNKFFSSVVRIQTDRGHVVVDKGPYSFIRHPGYTGGILLVPGFALIFGSLFALIPAAFVVLALIIRTILEDRTLKKELAGYLEYACRVRWRLLPGIF